MNRRRPLPTLLASLLLHGGVLLAVLVLASRGSELGALFIDLAEWAEARTGGDGTAAAPPPAARRAPARAPAGTLQPEPRAPAPTAEAAARPAEPASPPPSITKGQGAS